MRYGTEELYGLDPKHLANMRTIDYLKDCRNSAIAKRNQLVHEEELCSMWSDSKREMIDYLTKAINSREFLLQEMDEQWNAQYLEKTYIKKLIQKLKSLLRKLFT